MSDTREIAKAAQEWEEKVVKKTLARSPERKARFETTSGIEIKRI